MCCFKTFTKKQIIFSTFLEVPATDLSSQCLNANTAEMSSFRLRQRALHVFSEAQRVYDFEAACQEDKGLEKLGQLMFASHDSCRDQYECSHPQLDRLVELSRQLGAKGAR